MFWIAQCSLFITFINCRHNVIVYGVSKQHKHHSTYPSMCHCYEPGHFATFSLSSTSTPLSHKRQHLTNSLVWLKRRTCTEIFAYIYIYIYIGYKLFIFWYLIEEILWFTFISILSSKDLIHVMSIGLTVAQLVEAPHFKSKFREFKCRWGCWEYWFILFGRIEALGLTYHQTKMSVRSVIWG